MPYYETVFIARQELTEAQVKDLTDHFCKVITDNGGKIHKTEQWGLKNFAYRINKARRGHYVLLETDTPAPALLEMERQMRLHEDIIRYMSIREEELSDGPSVIMDKGDKGDRDDKRKPRRDDKDSKDKKEAA